MGGNGNMLKMIRRLLKEHGTLIKKPSQPDWEDVGKVIVGVWAVYASVYAVLRA